ncbi:N-formylglutamate amidohydrolase [Solimonas fluminis]|uniref:N-formylglutamate amidohydrolase n=1 Tax=Solimonas fluminis TaxID=2086571 RepID=A0A2S5TJK3_9GAMM|nr:N-formylglutamate amidohydrolase [Solimonas fluminis]PPE75141.1 N-formylglutamate amidohydrolase [Solimonas fluminis]
MRSETPGLLTQGDPRPLQVIGSTAEGSFLLLCDHAGFSVPRRLAGLGLRAKDLERHIGWDIGAAEVARRLAELLQAPLILQPYSRLVIDCNRPLRSAESIVETSDGCAIPGNWRMRREEASMRAQEIFHPYHDRIGSALDERRRLGLPTLLVSLHSFTPMLHGVARPWHVGLLSRQDARAAEALAASLQSDKGIVLGCNEPYALGDETDYSIPQHAERRGLPHVLIEIRQDLIADTAGQQQWAARLAQGLLPLADRFPLLPTGAGNAGAHSRS